MDNHETTSDDPHQGRIITQNPSLLTLLEEEKEMDNSVRRVYVNSPGMNDDDERYKYVSTDVDGFDELQDHALHESPTARNYPQTQKQPSLETIQEPRYSDRSRYEERNDRHDSRNERLGVGTEYVIRSREGEEGSRLDSEEYRYTPVKPIKSPLKPRDQQEEEDLTALEEEIAYQRELEERIRRQDSDVRKVEIPKLKLEDSDDDIQPKDSLDLARDKALMESVDDDNYQEEAPAESFVLAPNQGDGYPDVMSQLQKENAALLQQQQPGPDPWSQRNLENDMDKLNLQTQLQREQLEKERLRVQLEQKDLENKRIQQDVQRQQQQLILQQQQQLQTMMIMSQPVVMMPASQGVQSQNQMPVTSHNPQPIHGDPNQQMPLQYDNQHQPTMDQGQMYEQEPGAYNYYPQQEENLQEEYYAQHEPKAEAGDSSMVKPVRYESPRHDVDYVTLNKQTVQGKPKKSYGQIMTNKKELKVATDQALAPIPLIRKKKTKKTPLPNRNVGPASMPGSATTSNGDPESLWAMRSQHLAQKKEGAIGRRSGKQPPVNHSEQVPLQKFHSEGQMNAPQQYGSPTIPQPQRSMTEPVRSYIEPGSPQAPGQPIRHTVLTEDGQHVSVDINLKVLSPTPGQPQPAGAIIQEIKGTVSPVQRAPVLPMPQQQQAIRGPPPAQHHQQPMYQPAYQQAPMVRAPAPQNMYSPAQQSQAMMGSPPQQAYTQSPPYHGSQQPVPTYTMYNQAHRQRPIQQPHGYQADESGGYVGTGAPQYDQVYDDRDSPSQDSMNSYRVLPPIGSADATEGRSSHYPNQTLPSTVNTDQGGGYMDNYNKHKNHKFEYKTYTLKDYKALKREVKLGGLGPEIDTETHKERKEKLQRQQDYARAINERNRQTNNKPGRTQRAQSMPNIEEDDMLHRRKVALEYAKSVPKPKVVTPKNTSPKSPTVKGASQRTTTTQGLSKGSTKTNTDLDMEELQKLQQRHEQERKKVAYIQENLEKNNMAPIIA